MATILLVEDDVNLAFMLGENLEVKGFEVCHIERGEDVISTIQQNKFDILLMDVDLAGNIDGFDVAEEVRKYYPSLPIIFTTGKTHFKDIERGLRLRYVDYQKKPYGTKELVARINNLLNRLNQSSTKRFVFGDFSFNPIDQTINCGEIEQRLTKTEATFLRLLCENINSVVTKENVVNVLWGDEELYQKEHSLNNLTHKIRKYIDIDAGLELITISKVGYKLMEK